MPPAIGGTKDNNDNGSIAVPSQPEDEGWGDNDVSPMTPLPGGGPCHNDAHHHKQHRQGHGEGCARWIRRQVDDAQGVPPCDFFVGEVFRVL